MVEEEQAVRVVRCGGSELNFRRAVFSADSKYGAVRRAGGRACASRGGGGTVRCPGSPAAGGAPGGGRVPDPRARGGCGLGALVPGWGDGSETPSVPATAGWGALPAPDGPPRGPRRARGAGPRVPAGAALGGGRAAGAGGGGRVGLGASPGQVPRRPRPLGGKWPRRPGVTAGVGLALARVRAGPFVCLARLFR